MPLREIAPESIRNLLIFAIAPIPLYDGGLVGVSQEGDNVKLLCLSNGHGEDAIALRILQELQSHPDAPELAVLPLVGEGHAFAQSGIPIAGPVKQMPSGGFIYMDRRQLLRDLRGGLLQLTLSQISTVKRWAKSGGAILAVGDVVPLFFAWWSGAPFAFVGTAKSEYYLRDEVGVLPRTSWFERLEAWTGSIYSPLERWLMRQRRCKAVFPRDPLTTEWLQRYKINAVDLGNPMMDGLDPSGQVFQSFMATSETEHVLTVVLLPGSRAPEAYDNWKTILLAVREVQTEFAAQSVLFLGAIAPSLDLPTLRQMAESNGWQQSLSSTADGTSLTLTQGKATLILTTSSFADCLHQADFAIAMAGTATEQFVGLGKPAIIIPGNGPQFTPQFANAQTRLLGPSVTLIKQPKQAATVIKSLLQAPDHLQIIAENGWRRMGKPGAGQRIADYLMQVL